MKIFISWSGEEANQVAIALKILIEGVIQATDPWVSTTELKPGDRWSEGIAGALNDSNFGIICLTPGNQTSPWMNFEAGAISKNIGESRVVPYLYKISPTNMLNGPLKQFQGKKANREETTELLMLINSLITKPLSEARLLSGISVYWAEFEDKLSKIEITPEDENLFKRSLDDKVDDIIEYLRSDDRRDEVILDLIHQVKTLNQLLTRSMTSSVEESFKPAKSISSKIISQCTMQLRAFLKPAKFNIDHDLNIVFIEYNESNAFHFKQVLQKAGELRQVIKSVTNGEFDFCLISPSKETYFNGENPSELGE